MRWYFDTNIVHVTENDYLFSVIFNFIKTICVYVYNRDF